VKNTKNHKPHAKSVGVLLEYNPCTLPSASFYMKGFKPAHSLFSSGIRDAFISAGWAINKKPNLTFCKIEI